MISKIKNINETFIKEIIKEIKNFDKNNLENLKIIVPNKRTYYSLFNELNILNINIHSIYTFDSFIEYLSGFKLFDNLNLVLLLFKVKKELIKYDDSFEQFYDLGVSLLKDFNDIDTNLIEAKHIFISVQNQKELDEKLEFLTSEQKVIIKEFWNHYLNKKSLNTKYFFSIWNSILQIYNILESKMYRLNKGYKGFLLKEINKKINKEILNPGFSKIIIAGFTMLNNVEIKLFSYLKKYYNVKILWDFNDYYLNKLGHPIQILSTKYEKNLILNKSNNIELRSPNNIKIIETSSDNMQAEIVCDLILKINDKSKLEKSAIIISDEKIMKILINTLKRKQILYKAENELVIKYTYIYTFFNKIIKLQILLNSQYSFEKEIISNLRFEISKHKYFKLLINNISDKNIFHAIINTNNDIIKLLAKITNILKDTINSEQIFLEIIEKTILKLEKIYDKALIPTMKFLILFDKILINQRIKNEYRQNSINILRLQETKCLDFEYVFIVSANENKFSVFQDDNSIIPKNIRKAFDLPFNNDTNQYLSSLLFRLLKRSKYLNIIYKNNDILSGVIEPSRYILQLINDKNIKYEFERINPSVKLCNTRKIEIKKSQKIINEIYNSKIIKEAISPTAINTYLDCELKFYFKYIKNIKTKIKKNNNIIFGEILHKAIEILYTEKDITNEVIENRKLKVSQITDIIIENLSYDQNLIKDFIYNFENNINSDETKIDIFPKSENIEEKRTNKENNFIHSNQSKVLNQIFKNLIKKVLYKVLLFDKKNIPFKIVGSEIGKNEVLKTKIKIDRNVNIYLKGVIDRIEQKNNIIKIVDYKTGNYNLNIKSIRSLFDREDKRRNSIAFQLFVYSFIIKNKYNNFLIFPNIIGIKDLFKQNSNFKFKINNNYIDDITPYLDEFRNELINLFKEILNPEKSFLQTNNSKICQYCEYKNFCNK